MGTGPTLWEGIVYGALLAHPHLLRPENRGHSAGLSLLGVLGALKWG